jgi:hypothetical protein
MLSEAELTDSMTDLGGLGVGAEDFLAAVLRTIAQPVYRVCDLSRSLHWLMRIGGRPVTSTHTGAGEPVAGVWRGGLRCHWIVATSTRVCVLAEVPPDRRR